ncbi:MAG: SPFH domain-containing protein [Burkholderiaceae bacterium]|nr:SPFH domain-containing protein [Rhodoferax sp.]MCP5284476.1 SPFH domain-containing protein [Burkholderiaceae bacterium]
MSSQRTPERTARASNGYTMVAVGIGLIALLPVLVVMGIARTPWLVLPLALLTMAGVFLLIGLYMLQPNEAAILTLFGQYTGTDRGEGLRWANPLARKRKLSLRARNLNGPTLKVNDKRGNPVEIGAVVVWRVRHTAQAVFDVDDFETYVKVQAEAAVRHLASMYAYDDGEDLATGEHTLRGGMDAVAGALRTELQDRFEEAGVEVLDAKLSHLAYAPEIAQVMLRRQQAEAIVSARHKIVQGAVGMVEAALKGLAEKDLIQLDDERRATMVSNLLVVLCSDNEAQPVINAGTLYG